MGSRFLGWGMLGADTRTRVYARTSKHVDGVRLDVLMGSRFLGWGVLGVETWNAAELVGKQVDDVQLDVLMGSRFLGKDVLGIEDFRACTGERTCRRCSTRRERPANGKSFPWVGYAWC